VKGKALWAAAGGGVVLAAALVWFFFFRSPSVVGNWLIVGNGFSRDDEMGQAFIQADGRIRVWMYVPLTDTDWVRTVAQGTFRYTGTHIETTFNQATVELDELPPTLASQIEKSNLVNEDALRRFLSGAFTGRLFWEEGDRFSINAEINPTITPVLKRQ